MKIAPILVALTACVHLPHLEPKPRTPEQQEALIAKITTSCTEESPFNGIDWPDNQQYEPPIEWYPDGWATGVLVSERHVITAAHVVRCPIIPDVHATLRDGRTFRMWVEKDDMMFPHDESHPTDVARLVMASAENFELGVVPPALAGPDEGALLVIETLRIPLADPVGERRPDDIVRAPTYPGDSGAPVFTMNDKLAGVVDGGNGQDTKFEPAQPWWLEGT